MKIAILLIALFAAGCSMFPVGPLAKSFVDRYCSAAPETGRHLLRSAISTQIAPNKIKVICDGDGDGD